MSGPTIHQRIHGFLWHWRDGPGWCRSYSNELVELWQSGMRVLKVQLQDDGEIPRALADTWRRIGFKVYGMVGHVDGREPMELASWLRSERYRLALAGLDCNFEEDVRAMDAASGGGWSREFAAAARALMPSMPLHFDSYFGSAAGGINLGAYKQHGFRFAFQTFWGAYGIWDDPPTRMVKWCAGAQPPIPRAAVKPIVRIVATDTGQMVDVEKVVFPDCLQAGTKGIQWWYLDGCKDVDWLCRMNREAIRLGVAF